MQGEQVFTPVELADNPDVPRGIRNNNPGNIKLTNDRWEGMRDEQTDGTFVQFETAEDGLRALARVLRTSFEAGNQTVAEIISRYAPPSENDTASYIQFVADQLGVDPVQPLDFNMETVRGLMDAIIRFENEGFNPYSVDSIVSGIRRGLEEAGRKVSSLLIPDGTADATINETIDIAAEPTVANASMIPVENLERLPMQLMGYGRSFANQIAEWIDIVSQVDPAPEALTSFASSMSRGALNRLFGTSFGEPVNTESTVSAGDLEALRTMYRFVRAQGRDHIKTEDWTDLLEGVQIAATDKSGPSVTDRLARIFMNPIANMAMTIGQGTFRVNEEGEVILEDVYDFNAGPIGDRFAEIAEEEGMYEALAQLLNDEEIPAYTKIRVMGFLFNPDPQGNKTNINLGKIDG